MLARTAPPTALAGVQRRWRSVVGEAIAAETTPLGERAGVVTVGCRSAVWAEELTLLAPELLKRLNAGLSEEGGSGRVKGLTFVTRGGGGEP